MRTGSNRPKGPYLIAAGLAALLVLSLILAGPIHRQLDAWKVLPQPERLTELYYKDHATLPTTYSPGRPQAYSFTVHNLEYRDAVYSYEVTQASQDSQQVQPVSKGTFRLGQDGTKTIRVTVNPTDLGIRSQITTTLRDQASGESETIHYWVART